MSYDTFTVSAIVIVFILIVVVILISRSKSDVERQMRRLARQLLLLEINEEARRICDEIHQKHPDLCIGMDFTLRESKDGVEVDEWESDKPRP